MIAEYTSRPADVSVFQLKGGKTDITIRENITEDSVLTDGEMQTVWTCDETSCRWDGRVSISQIRANYDSWKAKISGNTNLGKAQAAKIAELSQACREAIENGVDYNGGHYSLTVYDQITINALQEGDYWHADGEEARLLTADDVQGLQAAAHAHIQTCQVKFNRLKAEVNAMADTNAVKTASWA